MSRSQQDIFQEWLCLRPLSPRHSVLGHGLKSDLRNRYVNSLLPIPLTMWWTLKGHKLLAPSVSYIRAEEKLLSISDSASLWRGEIRVRYRSLLRRSSKVLEKLTDST